MGFKQSVGRSEVKDGAGWSYGFEGCLYNSACTCFSCLAESGWALHAHQLSLFDPSNSPQRTIPTALTVGFGFSAGDFIVALHLVSTVNSALRDAVDSHAEHQELIRELYTLDTALRRAKTVELDESQSAEKIALQQAASQCQRTIDDYWRRIQKISTILVTKCLWRLESER